MTLIFSSSQAMVTIDGHAQSQGRRLVGSWETMRTNGLTDMTDSITFPTNIVSKSSIYVICVLL